MKMLFFVGLCRSPEIYENVVFSWDSCVVQQLLKKFASRPVFSGLASMGVVESHELTLRRAWRKTVI